MTESQFIAANSEKWEQLEDLLRKADKDPDRLHDLFVKVSGDLSYARTHYPNRSVRVYLNNLTKQVLDQITRKESKPKLGSFFTFFTETLPIEVYRSRRQFAIAVTVFVASIVLGVVTTMYNPDFPKRILGADYVHMTEQNIAKGDPMAVYKDEDMLGMTLQITFNNIRVSFFAFVLGILGGVGTLYILIYNGIMVGTFQYFFVGKGLFLPSFLTIWIHGAIEIPAIVFAGAAGLVLGTGVLFPGTYSRLTALRIHARRALTIVLGTTPLFVIAGLLESFVTRETGLPDAVRMGIIAFSFIFIIVMWVILPLRVFRSKRLKEKAIEHYPIIRPEKSDFKLFAVRSFSQNMREAVKQSGTLLQQIATRVLVPYYIVLAVVLYFLLTLFPVSAYELDNDIVSMLSWDYGGWPMYFVYWLGDSLLLLAISYFYNKERHGLPFMQFAVLHLWKVLIITFVFLLNFIFLSSSDWQIFIMLVISPFIRYFIVDRIAQGEALIPAVRSGVSLYFRGFFRFILLWVVLMILMVGLYLILDSSLLGILVDFFSWHEIFDNRTQDQLFIRDWLSQSIYIAMTPFLYLLGNFEMYSTWSRRDAIDLNDKLRTFGHHSTIPTT